MTPENILPYIKHLKLRSEEVKAKLSDPSVYSRPDECRKISKEYQKLGDVFRLYDKWSDTLRQMEENKKLLQNEKDEEFKSLISSDIDKLSAEAPVLEQKILVSLIPQDPNDMKDIIIEIRPGAGGSEASLFASELFRMYTHYAERRGWKHETLDLTPCGPGGVKEVIFSMSGDGVYPKIKYESGVHRVQRVPTTEASGRIHTSTVTVAVLPEAEDVEIEIKLSDLKFDVFRSSGPGGQSVNTTDSAVRVTHLPTGLSVASQQEKSQHRNKETALRILRAKLFEKRREDEAAKQAASKRAQIGTGDRSERIRTYNFHQNRVTDHRFGVSVHDLPRLLDGDLDILLDQIIALDCEKKLNSMLSS